MLATGELEMHEVKGFWEDDARVKIKVAASFYPFSFIAARPKPKEEGGGWEEHQTNHRDGQSEPRLPPNRGQGDLRLTPECGRSMVLRIDKVEIGNSGLCEEMPRNVELFSCLKCSSSLPF